MNLSKFVVLCSAVMLCACASGPTVQNGWGVREAANFPNDNVNLLRKDGSTAGSVSRAQMKLVAIVANHIAATSEVGSSLYLAEMSDPAMVNAFAWRDQRGIGYICVTLPMARKLGNDADQWAALLGHETGHLAREHGKANADREELLQAGTTVASIALSFVHVPIVGVAGNVGASVAATAVNAHYSRDQERDADALSVKYMVAAGYDPQGATRLQQTLLAMTGSSVGFFSSHPGGEERIRNIQALIEQQPPRGATSPEIPTNIGSAAGADAAEARLRALEKANAAEAASHMGKPGYAYETTDHPTPVHTAAPTASQPMPQRQLVPSHSVSTPTFDAARAQCAYLNSGPTSSKYLECLHEQLQRPADRASGSQR